MDLNRLIPRSRIRTQTSSLKTVPPVEAWSGCDPGIVTSRRLIWQHLDELVAASEIILLNSVRGVYRALLVA
jgi:hypothetical protein